METFKFLTEGDHQLLKTKAKSRTYQTDELILKEGEVPKALFMIQSGRVRVEKDYLGESIPITELGVGEVFGEMSFLEESTASTSIVADELVVLDIVDCTDLKDLLGTEPWFASRFYQSLAVKLSQRLRYTTVELTMSPYSWG